MPVTMWWIDGMGFSPKMAALSDGKVQTVPAATGFAKSRDPAALDRARKRPDPPDRRYGAPARLRRTIQTTTIADNDVAV